MAVQAAMALARAFGCVVVVSGKEDWVTDWEQCCVVSNGVALLTRVTGVGCALSALAAAFLALHLVHDQPPTPRHPPTTP
eukprot:3123081-Rhodomonas_salina.1